MNEEKIKKIAKTVIVLSMPDTKFEINGQAISKQEKMASIGTLMLALMSELNFDVKQELEKAYIKGAKISNQNPILALLLIESTFKNNGIEDIIKKANKLITFYDSIEEEL